MGQNLLDGFRHQVAAVVDFLPNQILATGYSVYHAYNVI